MPRQVDHSERRTTITDATRRVIARDGLGATTFQAVAAEAGISVRLVQYYFGNKDALLQATHRAVIESAAARFRPGSDDGDDRNGETVQESPKAVLETVAYAVLPLDDDRRSDALVLNAFQSASLNGDSAEGDGPSSAPRLLVDVISHQLGNARSAVPPDSPDASPAAPPGDAADHRLDAELLLSTLVGLTQSVLAEHLTPRDARVVVERLLCLLLP